MVDNLVEPGRRKVRELHFNDRPHAFDGRADGRADHCIFTDRRVDHSAGKLLREIFGRFERAAKRADVLPVNEDARIFCERCLSSLTADTVVLHRLLAPADVGARVRAIVRGERSASILDLEGFEAA